MIKLIVLFCLSLASGWGYAESDVQKFARDPESQEMMTKILSNFGDNRLKIAFADRLINKNISPSRGNFIKDHLLWESLTDADPRKELLYTRLADNLSENFKNWVPFGLKESVGCSYEFPSNAKYWLNNFNHGFFTAICTPVGRIDDLVNANFVGLDIRVGIYNRNEYHQLLNAQNVTKVNYISLFIDIDNNAALQIAKEKKFANVKEFFFVRSKFDFDGFYYLLRPESVLKSLENLAFEYFNFNTDHSNYPEIRRSSLKSLWFAAGNFNSSLIRNLDKIGLLKQIEGLTVHGDPVFSDLDLLTLLKADHGNLKNLQISYNRSLTERSQEYFLRKYLPTIESLLFYPQQEYLRSAYANRLILGLNANYPSLQKLTLKNVIMTPDVFENARKWQAEKPGRKIYFNRIPYAVANEELTQDLDFKQK